MRKQSFIRRPAIVALAALDTSAAADEPVEFPTAQPEESLVDLYAAFVNRKGGARHWRRRPRAAEASADDGDRSV